MLVITDSAAETEKLGQALGAALKGGEVIELASDLGGGKTTLVRGLAEGAGSNDHVSSPTFTVSKVYKTNFGELHHFDFYRLPEPGLAAHELVEVIDNPRNAVVVEWAETVRSVLPEQRLIIQISHLSDERRQFKFHASRGLEYLLAKLPSPAEENT